MAGVNVSTVSRALHDHPDIGGALKQKIRELADALHYHPNYQAVNFRRRRSRLIGLIIPEISMFFFPSVVKGVSSVLERRGYQLMVLPSHESAETEKALVRQCLENGVEGLLISLSQESADIEHLLEARKLDIPVVLFDKTQNRENFDKVIIDDRRAAFTCVQHLIDRGCRRIAGIFGNAKLDITRNREAGFRQALSENARLQPVDVRYSNSSESAAAECLSMLKTQAVDGLFAMSDETLVGAMNALRACGVRVPDACKVICISDGTIPNLFEPKVSYLQHSGYDVGSQAALRLLEHLEQTPANTATLQLLIPTALYPQGSTV